MFLKIPTLLEQIQYLYYIRLKLDYNVQTNEKQNNYFCII